MVLRFPGSSDRVAVLGRSGSGKTTAAVWHLSGKDFVQQPWVIANTKSDPLINKIAKIPGVKTIGIDDTPGNSGLYIVNPKPNEGVKLDQFFGRIWEKQNCGVYIDEGYMIDVTDNFNALLTQGRSRKTPMIILSQRPAWISKFTFSEANFVQVFHLLRKADRKSVADFVPLDVDERLPPYHSFWYDVDQDELVRFNPVPQADVILSNLERRLLPQQASAPQADVPERVLRRVI